MRIRQLRGALAAKFDAARLPCTSLPPSAGACARKRGSPLGSLSAHSSDRQLSIGRASITPVAQDYSFDVVSQFDRQELVNAVNQAQREIVTRYDFKDTGASIELGEEEIVLHGPSDFKLKAMVDVLQSKLIRRQLSLKILKAGPIEPAAKGTVRQRLELQQGLSDDLARDLVKQIKQVSPKVQPRIQGDAIRVSSREKDLLQQVIQALKDIETPVPLQFINYR
jgi:cyclic-di-GMP-binding protein